MASLLKRQAGPAWLARQGVAPLRRSAPAHGGEHERRLLDHRCGFVEEHGALAAEAAEVAQQAARLPRRGPGAREDAVLGLARRPFPGARHVTTVVAVDFGAVAHGGLL